MRPPCTLIAEATSATARSPWRMAISSNPTPRRRTGTCTSTSISSGAARVVNGPTKKSAACTVRSPRTLRSVKEPSSASSTAGISEAGSACARLPASVPRLRTAACATCT